MGVKIFASEDMSKESKVDCRYALKEARKKEITVLLAIAGPMQIREIVQMIEGISDTTVSRYLDELIACDHVRKTHKTTGRKNGCFYEFLNAHEDRVDIVSRALSHPLHQITLITASKA